MPNHVPLATRQAWPKLSESLPQLFVAPDQCQRCGAEVSDDEPASSITSRKRWIEHDEWDRPTSAVVVLCKPCSESLIEPHPRLYAEMPVHKPHAGTMALCVACVHRAGVRCQHPSLRTNGGPGLSVTHQQPTRGFLCGRGSGRRTGGAFEIYDSAPSACAGREEKNHDA